MQIVQLALTGEFHTVALTSEAMQALGLNPGDFAHVERVEEGVLLRACDDNLQHQLRIVHQVMEEDYEALRRLAKS